MTTQAITTRTIVADGRDGAQAARMAGHTDRRRGGPARDPGPVFDVTAKLQELGRKLKRVVVRDDNAAQYRDELDQLLELSGQHEMNDENLDPRRRDLYARLVKAAAWQESCWRQFRLKGEHVVYLESSTHDLGLMQVNKDVWRGFYSIPRLEWDIIYNAGSGMEILAQLLEDLKNRRNAMTPGKPDDLARSTYASYNGGPGAYRRWRGRESHEERLIDASFWQKFQAVSRGEKIDILTCAARWSKATDVRCTTRRAARPR